MPERNRAPANGARGNVVDIMQFLALAEELGMTAEREGDERDAMMADPVTAAAAPSRPATAQPATSQPSSTRSAPPSSREARSDARYGSLILYLDERLEELRQTMSRQSLRQEAVLRAEAMRQRKLTWSFMAATVLMAALMAADILLRA